MSGASASLLFNFNTCPPGGALALSLALSICVLCVSPQHGSDIFCTVRVCVFVVLCVFTVSSALLSQEAVAQGQLLKRREREGERERVLREAKIRRKGFCQQLRMHRKCSLLLMVLFLHALTGSRLLTGRRVRALSQVGS